MNLDINRELNLINKELRKEYRSTRNRIQSILYDSQFVIKVANVYRFPVVANERCGSWYVPPEKLVETCYFKSTDGHINNWDFSTRRLNFHILPLIAQHKGVLIIDSTRRGKKIPDSLSKTIPIWCAVLNAIRDGSSNAELSTPLKSIARSEHLRICEKLPLLVEKARRLDIISQQQLKRLFDKPLKPVWITPRSKLPLESQSSDQLPYIPIYLVTASFQCQDGTLSMDTFLYVQGAADDHELWSNGLTPKLLWSHLDYFSDRERTDEELKDFILSIRSKQASSSQVFSNLLEVRPRLFKAKLTTQCIQSLPDYDLVVVLDEKVKIVSREKNEKPILLHLPLTSGSKKSGKELRNKLPAVMKVIVPAYIAKKSILVLCGTGCDLSVGVILCLLSAETQHIDKSVIRKHLIELIALDKEVNPSRATLNSVNTYLMS
ncbi:hypothetical protein KL942_002898 [Ogataea angusta]|uniref:Initiator tRNA phosphoribosyl transferase n=1 Tax=Pichia angusta TaxID=870730 RepID=A0ABQ7RTR9_PICAN|nr:hypothetical protein KL943_003310 [Ogataea angusta]KAG7840099.1 hypothetical protein KL942_002898 [Ogataea angusta]KAG7847428.1 hypothetical protein KL940_003764 [Ogataea angusta]